MLLRRAPLRRPAVAAGGGLRACSRSFGGIGVKPPVVSDDRNQRFSELRARLLQLETSVVCDADKVNDAAHPTGLATLAVLDPAIAALNPDATMVGLARTVRTAGEEFLTVLHALCEAQEGEVIIIDTQGGRRANTGEIFATEAVRKGVAGIVIDGYCRDSKLIREIGLPYYSRGITPCAGSTSTSYGEMQCAVTVGGASVEPGMVVFGDADGVLVGSIEDFEAVVEQAETIAAVEEAILEELGRGLALRPMTNVDEHVSNVVAAREAGVQTESRLAFDIPCAAQRPLPQRPLPDRL